VYDFLLTAHLLSAAITFVTVALFSAWAFGVAPGKSDFALADWAWNISGAGLLIFGVWLALYVDGYEIWDGWILGGLVLFGAASFFGARARTEALAVIDGTAQAQATVWHWLRALAIVGLLVLMIWKPGA
jgi:hypothetical protein